MAESSSRWGTVDAEMKALSVENPQLFQRFSTLKPGVAQSIAVRDSLTAKKFASVISGPRGLTFTW